jgi:hypothetical protein
MGFKSVMKKVGKVGKIVAPFALDFLPGGQLLHLAMATGLGAATSKGGVKSRLLGAATSAGNQYAGNVLKGGKFNPLASGARGTGGIPLAADQIEEMGVTAPMKGSNVSKNIFSVGAKKVGSGLKNSLSGNGEKDGIVSSLLKNPATYMAVLSAFKDPNQDSRKAYGIDATDSLNRAFASARGNQDMVGARLRDPSNYNTAANYGQNRVIAPVNIGPLQIGGGLATTPEEEQLRREQELNRG